MAIDLEIIQAYGAAQQRGGIISAIQMPPVAVDRISAAGVVNLNSNSAELIWLRNGAAGDTVYVRVNLDADNTPAAVGDGLSIRLQAGDSVAFALPSNTNAGDYKLDVRL